MVNHDEVKRLVTSAVLVYALGVAAITVSYLVPLGLSSPELQANAVLAIAIVPSVLVGARFYYKTGLQTSVFVVGTAMFIVAACLDAVFTVPVFILPSGGSYASFYAEPGFWLVAVVYIAAVAVFRLAGCTKKKRA